MNILSLRFVIVLETHTISSQRGSVQQFGQAHKVQWDVTVACTYGLLSCEEWFVSQGNKFKMCRDLKNLNRQARPWFVRGLFKCKDARSAGITRKLTGEPVNGEGKGKSQIPFVSTAFSLPSRKPFWNLWWKRVDWDTKCDSNWPSLLSLSHFPQPTRLCHWDLMVHSGMICLHQHSLDFCWPQRTQMIPRLSN